MRRLLCCALLLLGAAAPLGAQTITVTGAPVLRVSTATAGSAPTAFVSTTSTYAVDTRTAVRQITARLTRTLPAGVTLIVTLTAPTGGTSRGAVTLTTTAQQVVSGIPRNVVQSGLTIRYELRATSAAGTTYQAPSGLVTFVIS